MNESASMSLPRQWFKRVMLGIVLLGLAACSSVPGVSMPAINVGTEDSSVADVRADYDGVRESRAVSDWLDTALAASAAGDAVAADAAFTEMMALQPRSPLTVNHYAIFLREHWRIDEAEAVYRQALALVDNDWLTHWNIAVLYELYRGDLPQAKKHFEAYREAAAEPDPRVDRWLVDLDRRIAQQESAQ